MARAHRLLANGIDFDVLPNLNPEGRTKVLAGDLCLRMDAHGVDINRNYGGAAHWSAHEEAGFHAGETNPGPAAFSEPGSQFVRRVLSEPGALPVRAFAAIHSGEFAMFNAPAWTDVSDPMFSAGTPANGSLLPTAAAVQRMEAALDDIQ